MSPTEQIAALQRQVVLMQARMERMKSQRDTLIDFTTETVELLNELDHDGDATRVIEKKVKELRAKLGQDEIL